MSVDQFELAVEKLGAIVEEVVFLGGAAIHVWITEQATPDTRVTYDVDVVCEVTSLPDYYRLEDRLRGQGLVQSEVESVICRWHASDGSLAIDVMPQDEEILGFSNDWYAAAIENAAPIELPSGAIVRVARPVELIATKLCAWKGRGENDLLRSFDVHDVFVLIDGRPELAGEMRDAQSDVRDYIKSELQELAR